MTDAANPNPVLVFSYREDELWTLRMLIARRVNRKIGWGFFVLVFYVICFTVGLPVLAASKAGWLSDDAFKPVLLTAYIAFCAGVLLLYWLLRFQQRRSARRLFHETSQASESWELACTEAGLVCKGDLFETRVAWRAVKSIEALPGVVVIWFARVQNFCIPAHIFADDAARDAFIAAIKARIPATEKKP